ncbi:amidohydrolase [Halobacillus salinarum]|uniref:Amidohydrolase n=1 Tax=Halobacillus salinarum TaxID=2932257 RepID=A0ABY4EE95_9BACI|nr:amidohydrolase [Halobacillus salinarum]UOQ42789.1 amidohydrolase [Halobacillus salinarum]
MIIDHVRIYDPTHYPKDEKMYAVEVNGDKITNIKTSPYQGDAELYDGGGKVLSPAFNDSHMHLLRFGLLKKELDLTEAESWKDMKKMVENHYQEIQEGDWIFGKGFNDDNFDDIDHLLTADDLSDIHVNAHIYFMHEDGHECVISRQALELLKEEQAFEQIPEEFKELDSKGNWNGRFKDTAVHYIKRHFWGRSVEDAKRALKAAGPYLKEQGITSVHTDDINFMGTYDKLWKAYTELEEEGELDLDVSLHHYVFNKNDVLRYVDNSERRTGEGTDQVKVGAFKIFLDGTQRLHTSAMRNPYPDAPSTQGTLVYSQEELNEMVAHASKGGMQVAMHAIGDRAVEQAISAFEQKEARTKELRHRIIHAQTLGPDLIDRLRRLKPYIETQPSFLLGEWDKKDKWTKEELLPYCDPFNSLVLDHIPMTLSSDLPIGSINPLISIYTAVNRMDLNRRPQGGWMPQEKIKVKDAFYGFTAIPAELEFRENQKGSIEEGCQADFVLLSEHPEEAAEESIKDIKVEETWFRGEQIYKK